MSKDKNAEKINIENTGETFLALTLTHRSPPTPSFLFSTFLISTKVGFTTETRPMFLSYLFKKSDRAET
jgi:hypothetical protein